MKAKIGYAALPLVLAMTAGGTAIAQTALPGSPVQLTQAEQTTVYRTIVRERVAREPVRSARPQAKNTRNVVRTTTHERVVTRPVARERIVREQPAVRERIVTSPAPVAEPLQLTPAQSQVIYRMIVERPAPVVAERLVTAPPVTTVAPQPSATVEQRIVTVPAETTGVTVIEETSPARFELAVGSRIPSAVPLYDMPEATVSEIPAMSSYRYALIGDRVYLVDPGDGIVVGMLYR